MKKNDYKSDVDYKITKKRYLFCPKCNNYSRIEVKSPSPFLYFLGGWLLMIFVSSYKSKYKKICKKCGNKDGLRKEYLNTEVDVYGKEIAFYLPNGGKQKINF
ncbi:MAG: hypothetical protein ABIF80_04720 [Patescibacteria group bacterium]